MALAGARPRARGSGRAARAGRRRRPRRRWRNGSRGRPSSTRSSAAAASTSSRRPRAASRSPSRPMPVSYLTWTRGRTPSSRRARRAPRGTPRRQTASSARACRATSSSAPVSAPIVRIGTSAELRAQLERLARGRDRERLAPPRRAASAHSRHAVAVAVRLDDRAELGAVAEPAAQVGAVALDRAEVDDRQRALERASCSRSGPQPPRQRLDHVRRDHRLDQPDPLGGDASRRGRARGRRRRRPRRAPSRARSAPRSCRRGRRRSRRSPAPGCRGR